MKAKLLEKIKVSSVFIVLFYYKCANFLDQLELEQLIMKT